MKITWHRCHTYEDAKDYTGIIYLHEWGGEPFYWGKAHKSFFGGHKREQEGITASGRYNTGYRHWIEGCLQHGACLFVGKLDHEAFDNIDEVENYLISKFGHKMNKKVSTPPRELRIEHTGSIPFSIRDRLVSATK